jgi:membrane-associated HD superfamily phosphohydrolase
MKKLLVLLVIFVGILLAISEKVAVADELRLKIEGDSLIADQTKEVVVKHTVIPNPPKGITMEEAYKIAVEKGEPITVKDKIETEYIFSWPIEKHSTVSERKIFFVNNEWKELLSTRAVLYPDWFLTTMIMIVPALIILIVTLVNQFSKTISNNRKKLLAFYASIAIISLIVCLSGFQNGWLSILFWALSMSSIVITATSASRVEDGVIGFFFGVVLATLMGLMVTVKDLVGLSPYYFLFFIGVMLASFLIAWFVGLIIKKIRKLTKSQVV